MITIDVTTTPVTVLITTGSTYPWVALTGLPSENADLVAYVASQAGGGSVSWVDIEGAPASSSTLASYVESQVACASKFGDIDAGNFSEFESDGTLKCNGDAKTWDDIIIPIESTGKAVAAPQLEVLVGNILAYQFAINDKVYANCEMPHDYAEGTPIEVHLHWASNGLDNSNNRFVKWQCEYSEAYMAMASPFIPFATVVTVSAETTIPLGTPDKSHLYTRLGIITDEELKIGSIIRMTITRIASSGLAASANPYGLSIGIHYQQDTLGSRQMAIK